MKNNIIRLCEKNGYTYEVMNCILGYKAIDIICKDHTEFDAVFSTFKRKKACQCELFPYCSVVRVYDKAEYDDIKKTNEEKSQLINVFYTSVREGKTQNEAKAAAETYAKENDMMKAFNLIYG